MFSSELDQQPRQIGYLAITCITVDVSFVELAELISLASSNKLPKVLSEI
jgi:hypothetical protein